MFFWFCVFLSAMFLSFLFVEPEVSQEVVYSIPDPWESNEESTKSDVTEPQRVVDPPRLLVLPASLPNTVRELREVAKRLKIKNYGRMKKDMLLSTLRAYPPSVLYPVL